MRSNLIVALLSVLMILQFILFFSLKSQRTSNKPQVKSDFPTNLQIDITKIPSKNEFLESDLRREGFNLERIQEFRVTNNSSNEIEVSVASPSCGCISFLAKGELLKVNEGISLNTRTSLVIGLKTRLPSSPQTINRSFELIAKEPSKEKVLLQKKMFSKFGVYKNFSTNIQEVEFVINSKKRLANESSALMYVTTPIEDPKNALIANPSDILKDDLDIEIVPQGNSKMISTRFFRHEYKVLFTLKQLAKLNQIQYETESLYVQMSTPSGTASSALNKSPNLRIPVSIKDASQLDTIRSINFGIVNPDTPKSRSILISTFDKEPFFFATGKQDGPGVLKFKKNTNEPSQQIILTTKFSGDKPGTYTGTFTITPENQKYHSTRISYFAKVIKDEK
ncbi:hypothetical protein [Gimesia aquarii]|uniref:DUF1573 domain-containing protein n=1 Tax=Gimesia aquarii TaxID=2527964 RepID=A0A517W151_9PLAN|nr:hypothetical protein [Gimesia aquarii]QDT98984.1 hypothetical protein V144x_44940 [Gimesia aquarii]